MEDEYTEQWLTRSNKHQASFRGKELAHGTTKETDRDVKWTQVRVFFTDKEDYVVGVSHKTSDIHGKKEYHVFTKLGTLDDVERKLTEADPGDETSESYKAMTRRVMESIHE